MKVWLAGVRTAMTWGLAVGNLGAAQMRAQESRGGALGAGWPPPERASTADAGLPACCLVTLRYPLVTLERQLKINPLKTNDLSAVPGLGAPTRSLQRMQETLNA